MLRMEHRAEPNLGSWLASNRRLLRCAGLAALALVAASSGAAGQVTTQQPASILFFPLVSADGSEDTLLQISNASNNLIYARCFYVAVDAGTLQVTDFAIQLPRQQPTQWVASRGRPFDPTDPRCSAEEQDCSAAGLDPGVDLLTGVGAPVPPAPAGFRGALTCVQVDVSGAPIGGNNLIGLATIVGAAAGDAFGYAAIGSLGNELSGSDPFNTLQLGGVGAGEYEGCPQSFVLNHLAEGAGDDLLGSGSEVATGITAMPCSVDLVGGQAASVTLDFQVTTELEDTFSASTTVDGWLDANLSDIDPVFGVGSLGAPVVRTRITASSGGAVIVGSELRASATASATTGFNLHRDDEERDDAIVLPDL